jgi:hypothetical protein
MFGRLVFLALVGVLSAATIGSGALAPRQADAAASIGSLTFSTDMNDKFEPTGQVGIEFDGDNNGIAVTFPYSDLPSGSGLSRIVRLNGEDYNWDSDVHGHLSCCGSGGSGRYGFWIVKRGDGDRGDLAGGSWDVRVYLNGTEVQHGGFGIKGTGGGDSDGQSDNGNDNN